MLKPHTHKKNKTSLPRSVEDIAREYCMSITVGGGLVVYGTAEAIGRVQNFILLDSSHSIEKEDVRRSLARDLQAAEARVEKLEERCSAYKGQVEAGASEIERLRARVEELEGALIPSAEKETPPWDW
jgi:predicted RNase H-like nuclease (RuvC/YqgF family)